jgi:predicted negative regulator of RcsB-dependent stress response
MKERFASTSYAQQAALVVAKAQYDAGQVDSAKAALSWVAGNASDKGYVAIAKLRLAGVLMDAKAYDDALKTLDADLGESFSALRADRRGDILLAQGKKLEAKAEYLKAYKEFEERVDYRRLVEVKLSALGAYPGDAAK